MSDGQPSVEAWCATWIAETSAERKLAPGPLPQDFESGGGPRAPERPGRPATWRVVQRAERPPRGLSQPAARAKLLHVLAHHELQAAELFAWALLAFPKAPEAFRRGLLRLCGDELRHLSLLVRRIEALGSSFGAHPVRDWFWERVPSCTEPASFVALLGLGLEGANLEHAERLAGRLRAAGDQESAALLEVIERDEVTHVAFAVRWFERLTGSPLDYDGWRTALPKPLTPAILKGEPLNRGARLRAGLDEAFLERLAAEPRAGGPKAAAERSR